MAVAEACRGHQIEFLTKKLSLTPDQVTQVKAIDADTWKQVKALHEDTSIAEADKRAKMMEIHKASQDKIRALLTDDQKTKYDAMQAEMRERRRDTHGGRSASASATATVTRESPYLERVQKAGGRSILRPSCVPDPPRSHRCGYNEEQ